MQEIIEAFHLDIKSILAQMINFAIVLFVLFRFAYKPLLKKMNERTDIIQKGLDDAKKSQEELENAEKIREKRIFQAKKDAKKIIEEARIVSEKNGQEIVEQAKEKTQKIVQEAKLQIQQEKRQMLGEAQEKIGQVVVSALEKIFKESELKEKDKILVDQAIKEINERK